MRFLSMMGNSFGCSASGERLVSAARDGDLQEAKALLEYNPRLARYSTFGVRNSPLHYSASQGHREIVSLLLEAGVDINVRNYRGQTALMQACQHGHWEVVQTLVLSKANIHKVDCLNGGTALHLAALNGHSRCIRLLLADYVPSIPNFWSIMKKRSTGEPITEFNEGSFLSKIINKPADGGITALHMASLNGHVESVQLLLDLGASVSEVTVEDGTTIDLIGAGSTPLHYAACGGNAQCCQVLIATGRKGGIFGPGNRWGHTCNSIRGGKLLYVFGGYGQDNCQTNDVFVFDSARQTWSKPMVKGNPPSPRDSHSCTTVGNNLFVFGGTDGRDPLKDLHILDTGSNTWISPSFRGEGPEAREGHSAALVGKRLFIFGGCGKSQESSNDSSNEVYFNDIYILDTETLVWRRAMTSGKQPSPRDSHSCSSWKNKLIVVAGEDASDYYLSDVHVLDTDTLVWKQLMTLGQKLPPRAGHSTVALGKNLFVFGGFTDERNLYDDLHMLNLETGVWTKVTATGQGPSARFSVAGDCLDARKGVLVFIGGCNKDLEALDDMFYLHTDIMMENGQDEPRHEKLSLRKELKRKCQEEQQLSSSLPANNSIVHNVGTMPEVRQIPVLTSCGQTDVKSSALHEMRPTQEHIFEAKVTEAFHYGYTIETNINGKPLRGIVFSYKPGFAPSANSYLSRNITVDGIGDDNKLNGSHKSKSEISALTQWDAEDHIQKDAKESTSHESPVETTTAPASNNSTVADVSLLHTASVNSETSPMPPPKDHRPDQPNGDISKEMLTSPQTQVTDETTSSIKEA